MMDVENVLAWALVVLVICAIGAIVLPLVLDILFFVVGLVMFIVMSVVHLVLWAFTPRRCRRGSR